jgi:hypothetical protein
MAAVTTIFGSRLREGLIDRKSRADDHRRATDYRSPP